MTRLYISGPMSGVADHNFPAFRAAAEKLRAHGYDVEDPSEKGEIEGWAWADYLRHDLPEMLDCDAVATLPGWTGSRGANLEVSTAKALGMPVFPVEHWLTEARPAAPVLRFTLDDLRAMAHADSGRWFPALHDDRAKFLIQSALGLAGETGEAVDVIKKWHRAPGAELNREALGAELADVLIYLLHICTATEIDLEAEYLKKAAKNEGRFGAGGA